MSEYLQCLMSGWMDEWKDEECKRREADDEWCDVRPRDDNLKEKVWNQSKFLDK